MRQLILCCILVLCFSVSTAAKELDHLSGPHLFLWAWERPEDLSFVDPKAAGIAFFAGTVRIKDNRTVIIAARHQPLKVSYRSSLIAVVRIEPDRLSQQGVPHTLRFDAAAAIIRLIEPFNITQVQIDFDARVSERTFYRELLEDLRKRLPEHISLSITALASWCIHDRWINNLPVDYVVPMLFRMGPESREIVRFLEKNGDFREPLCRSSIGVSTDERIAIPPGKRVYVFSPVRWTEDMVEDVLRRSKDGNE